MQGFGGGFGMPQQQGFGNTFARTMPPQQGFGPDVNNYASPMRPMVGFPAPQQDSGAQQAYNQFMQQRQQDSNQMREAQNAATRFMGMPQSEGGYDADMGKYNQISAERNMAARAAQANQPPASMEALANQLRGIGGALGGASQSAAPQAQDQMMQQQQMPPSPYSQQMRQEDPRMQFMRNMQRMRFGGF
jgi:hypothetical protein